MPGSDLAQQRLRYQHALRSALERMVSRLSAMEEVEHVILFGSYAEGREDLFTDLDLLVVMHSEEDFVTRTGKLYQSLHPGVDLDLFAYTPAEFDRMRQHGFVRHAVETGKLLYARQRS